MRSLALLVLMLFAQVPSPPPPATVPDDFALRFEFGCGDRDTIDTFAGTYSGTYRSQSTRIEVSPDVKRGLFTAVQEARFFDVPSSVSGGAVCEPTIESYLEVRANGVTHRTTWNNCYMGPDPPELVARLYRLGSAISAPFQKQKSVQRLRRANYLCL
jgi:hypothetical protein